MSRGRVKQTSIAPVAFRRIAPVLLISASCAFAQLSPGRLSKAHQSLEGLTKCAACHALDARNGNAKCLSCHTDIRERLHAKRGLHPALVGQARSQPECFNCHAEHNGEAFVPIRWDVDLEDFDHRKTGYRLEGRHRGLECRKCHTPKNIRPSERRKVVVKDLTRTYLGLSRDCSSCHADEHRSQLSSDCLRCHTFSEWKPASRFDHGEAKYQLTGAHRKVPCDKCHQKIEDAKPYTRFARLPFSTCASCHEDPHRGAFPAPCQSCHASDGWKPAHLTSQFDHSGTRFALAGKHSSLPCGKCHLTSNYKAPVAHARCMDCHKTDVHRGQFATRADRGECSACHTVGGWKPSTFNAAAHRTTRYPLEGRHVTVICAKCHIPAGQATIYKIEFGQCSACHSDTHKGQFAGRPHMNRCEDCHTVKQFRPSTYSVARHAESRFLLAGAHLAVACARCHDRPPGGGPPSGRFRSSDISCTGCHEDPHQGQFTRPGGCESCHSLRTWRDVTKVDHSSTSFPLKGAHRGTPCAKCHRPAGAGPGIKTVAFGSAPEQCAACHADIHGGQFASSPGGSDCGRCHGPLEWKPASFDHDATNFSLTGGHRGVACGLCHQTRRHINGRSVMLFKPTPTECGGCHGPQVTG